MREFTTAAKAVAEEGDVFGWDTERVVDGRTIKFLPATEGQMAMMIGSDIAPMNERVSSGINFFFGLLRDHRDVDYFKGRMFDRADPFGSGEIAEIVQDLIEEWSGDPTQSSSDSTPSPPSTGESSTASTLRAVSTPSSSDQTASVT
jgi:hypothetical protein